MDYDLLADINELGGSDDEHVFENEEQNDDSNVQDNGKRKASEFDNDLNDQDDVDSKTNSNDMEDVKLMDVPEGGEAPTHELKQEDVEDTDMAKFDDPNKVAKLWSSKAFQDTISKIDHYSKLPPSDMSNSESDEYKLIVQANHMNVEIDNDMVILHKFTRDHYAGRFKELESLVTSSALDYCRAVKAIGNPENFENIDQMNFDGVIVPAVKMVITISASTTKGQQLPQKEWEMVERACDLCEKLDESRQKISSFIESRISTLAPNLSEIIGTKTCTKLISIAGGLQRLSKIPADSLYLLGAQRKADLGFATGSLSRARRHTGFIYDSELVQSMSEEYRRRAQRTISAKCALAVRVDIAGSQKDGAYGRKLLEDIEKKLDKMAAPPPSKVVKALPVPQENSRKRRGGKRARKAKESYATTELSKMRNRLKFGEAEEEDSAFDETVGLGMIGSSSGRLRANTADERTKAKMSKSNKNRLAMLRGASSGTATTSGISSSLSFTPVQGMELVDPRAKKVKEANDKWFAGGTFSFVGSKGNSSTLPGSGSSTQNNSNK